MEEIIYTSEYSSSDLIPLIENLELINDNMLVLLDKIEYLTQIQFTVLVLGISIIVLAIIYNTVMKFIR